MTTDVDTKPLQGTAFFSRKVSDGNYGSIEASYFIQHELSDDVAALSAFAEAKANVLAQLGIAFDMDAEGVIVETFAKPAFTSQAQTVASVQQAFAPTPTAKPAAAPAPAAGGPKKKVWNRILFPDGRKDERGGPAKLGNPSWLFAEMDAKKITDVWDNRKDHPAFGGPAKTKNGKDARNLPWFSEKDGKQAIWPPKDHPDASPTYVHPDFAADTRGVPNDDETEF